MEQQQGAEEISGVLSRVNVFGAATERMFSRLYKGLNKRAKVEERQRVREELENKIASSRQLNTQNNQLLENLRQRNEELNHLQGVLATLDDGIIMQDNEGRVVFINKAARDLLGTQKNFWQTELGMMFASYKDMPLTHSDMELSEPKRVQMNNGIVGAQLAVVAGPDGERLGTMMLLRDMTYDALTDRLKDQFVTAISHELKTPMTVIKGMSEVLLMDQGADPNTSRRFLETLSRNVDILDRMVVELLDVSEMDAGTFEIRKNPLHLEPLIWSIVNGVAPEVKKKRLDVKFMARDVDKLIVRGDEQRLRWAMGHLIQNSVSYTENNGHIMVTAGLDDKNFITIDFIDDGVGISDKDLPHIFERFYRGDPRNKQGKLVDPRGLGQGLFVARTIAEKHGGYVEVETALGTGSAFTLALPATAN